MAAVVHMTSILLGCWISEVTYAASLLTAYDKKPSEAWPLWPYPSARHWGHPAARDWQPQGEVSPLLPLNSNTAKNTARGKIPSKKSQTKIEMAKPRTFEIKFQGPMANTEDRKSGHDYSHSHGSSRFHLGSQLESQSRDSSYTGPFNYRGRDQQGSSKPGFHLSLSVPLLTTEAPKLPGGVAVKDTFYTGPSQTRFHYPHHMPEVNKPVYQDPNAQKPAESKFVTFLSGLFNHRGQGYQNSQTNTENQQNQVFFKPVAQRHPSGQTGSVSSHHRNPTNYWAGQMHVSSSTDAESDVQNPSHQAVQNTVHYSPQWLPVPNPTYDSSDVRNRILQYAKYVNGQLMIPLEKCPGFERLAAHIQNYHHGYSHHHHHSHPNGPMPTKPPYTKFVLNMEGAAPNPNEPTQGRNEQQSGTYHERPFRWWPGTGVNSVSGGAQNQFVNPLTSYVQPDSQQSIMKPGHTNYVVELGANVGHDKIPDTQSQNNFRYVVPRRAHAY